MADDDAAAQGQELASRREADSAEDDILTRTPPIHDQASSAGPIDDLVAVRGDAAADVPIAENGDRDSAIVAEVARDPSVIESTGDLTAPRRVADPAEDDIVAATKTEPIDDAASSPRPIDEHVVGEVASHETIAESGDVVLNGTGDSSIVGHPPIVADHSSDEHFAVENVVGDAAPIPPDTGEVGPMAKKNVYVAPTMIVTPVDRSETEPSDTPAKVGFVHAASQTTVTSAPPLRVDNDTGTVVEDPVVVDSVAVIQRYQRIVRRLFDHYGADGSMDENGFVNMAMEFSILPTLIEPDELGQVFRATTSARRSLSSATPTTLTFRDLMVCLTRLALTIYRLNPRLLTTEQKLSSLFRAMQLDQKDIILHRLRKSVPTAAASGGPGIGQTDAGGLDFEQKDLDDEIERIMESLRASSDTQAEESPPASDVIGPLSAQIRSTLDKVRLHTTTTTTAPPRRPSTPGASSFARRLSSKNRGGAQPDDDDPFRRPIVPHAPPATLQPLFYAGAAPPSSYVTVPAGAPMPVYVTMPAEAARTPAEAARTPAEAAPASGAAPVSQGTKPAEGESTADVTRRKRTTTATADRAARRVDRSRRQPAATGSEQVKEVASKVADSAEQDERRMQRRHLDQLDRRRQRQLERVKIPAQFAGQYSSPARRAVV